MADDKHDPLHHTDWKETPGQIHEDATDPNTFNRAQDEANAHQGNLNVEPPKGDRAPGLNK